MPKVWTDHKGTKMKSTKLYKYEVTRKAPVPKELDPPVDDSEEQKEVYLKKDKGTDNKKTYFS